MVVLTKQQKKREREDSMRPVHKAQSILMVYELNLHVNIVVPPLSVVAYFCVIDSVSVKTNSNRIYFPYKEDKIMP